MTACTVVFHCFLYTVVFLITVVVGDVGFLCGPVWINVTFEACLSVYQSSLAVIQKSAVFNDTSQKPSLNDIMQFHYFKLILIHVSIVLVALQSVVFSLPCVQKLFHSSIVTCVPITAVWNNKSHPPWISVLALTSSLVLQNYTTENTTSTVHQYLYTRFIYSRVFCYYVFYSDLIQDL